MTILTGPPACGKNTIATLLAHHLQSCVAIDVDQVRWMVMRPHKAPWQGEEGKRQQLLGVQNTCLLTQSFLEAGFPVLILDVLSSETADLYKKLLASYVLHIVLLLPTFEEIVRRNKDRPRLTAQELSSLYKQALHFTQYDELVDNTTLSAENLASWLLTRYPDFA